MSDIKVLESVNVGPAPNPDAKWEVVPVHFNGFASLNAKKGTFTESPEFNCCGNRWCLRLYPGGDSETKDGFITIFLYNCSGKSIVVEFDIAAKGLPVCQKIALKSFYLMVTAAKVRAQGDIETGQTVPRF